MITIRRILCPTNLSSEADEALRYAVALASAYDAKLFLLYCTEVTSTSNESAGPKAGVAPAPLFTESLAPHLGLKTLSELKWEGVVAHNVPDIGKAIVLEAANREVDLIVMRSRRRPHAAVLLGSTAETVCRTASCPVLVTHPLEREWIGMSTGEIDLRRILVAYDFSRDAEVALKYGLSLAQEYQTELHLLHVLTKEEQEEPEIAWSHVGLESAYKAAARQLQAAVPKEAFLWCNVVNAVRSGKAHEEVLAYAKEHEIDLICIGGSGTHFALGVLFGSNVNRVLRKAPCPVLVARPAKVQSRAAS
jgi:nucleotide-binding universal stress UspA family protein